MATATQDYRRRTPRDLANRPTKQLLKDVNYLKQRMLRDELTADEAATLRATERELRGRTGGIREVRRA